MIRSDISSLATRMVAVVVATVVVASVGAPAMGADFETDSDEWHGLLAWYELLETTGVEVRQVETLDFAEVDADDVVIVVYPREALDVAGLASFVVDGGRLLVADDFGRSEPLLERLDLTRFEPPAGELPHDSFVDDQPGWPRFSVPGEHPLLDGVDEVVANYPAVLDHEGGAVVEYDQGGGLVYDMELGAGRTVVVADPGMFINAMLGVADNRRLAANTSHYLCGEVEDCRAWLLVENMAFVGEYGDEADEETDDELARRIEEFNDRVREVLSELPGTRFLYFAGIFIALGMAAYLATVFPWGRARRLSDYIGRRQRGLSQPLTEFDWNVERFTDPEGEINYALPMAILKESFQELFFEQFDVGEGPEGRRPGPGVVAKRFEERYLRDLPPDEQRRRRRVVEQLLKTLAKVPDRHRVFLESDDQFSARDLRRVAERVRRVLGWMELEEVYERRIRDIDDRSLQTRR